MIWTEKEIEFLKENYRDLTYIEIGKNLGRDAQHVRIKACRMGLVRTRDERQAVLKKCKKTHRSRPVAAQAQSPKKNTLFDGAITIRTDKLGNSYCWIKITNAQWKPLHRHNYEQQFGPIPKRMIVFFKDGDTLNAAPSNLELITRAVYVKRIRMRREERKDQLSLFAPLQEGKSKKKRVLKLESKSTKVSSGKLQKVLLKQAKQIAKREMKEKKIEEKLAMQEALAIERARKARLRKKQKAEEERKKVAELVKKPLAANVHPYEASRLAQQGMVRIYIDAKTSLLVPPHRVEKVRRKYGLDVIAGA